MTGVQTCALPICRSIHTANGIEVKIPTELLNEKSEVEFLHDADGSVSLLIKNVIL